MLRILGVALVTGLVAGCSPIEHRTEMLNPIVSEEMVAVAGDNVMSFKSTKSLPDELGMADILGRRVDTGRVFINFTGTNNGKAVFVRQDYVIDSNATTASESGTIIPQFSNTYDSGYAGNTFYSGTSQTTTYQYIPPKGSQQNTYAQPPVAIELAEDETYTISGKTLRVLSVEENTVRYTIQ